MKKLPVFFVLLLVLLTVMLRLYKLREPIADWHSFRQTDTASVARIFVADGIDILRPRYHDLSNIQSGKDNPNGWRMVEMPLYQATAAYLSRFVPGVPIEVWLRLVTIAAATGSMLLIVFLMSAVASPVTGLMAGFIYAVLPYSIFFGRTVLPETFAVFWALLSVAAVYRSLEKRGYAAAALFVLGALSAGISVLVKPTAGFLLLPVPYLLLRRYGVGIGFLGRAALYGGVSLLPLLWWREWISQYPEGIPVFEWLLNKGDIRFKGAWFQWLFAERLGHLMLGYWGLIPFGLGILVHPSRKEGWLLHLMGLGSILFVSVFAAGNVQHDYYQIIVLPGVAMYTGKGMVWLITEKSFPRLSRYSLLTISILFTVAFSWYTIRTNYWINRPEIIDAGKVADALLPKDAKVIAPYNGDTTFLYQTGRSGWPLGFDIDEKITMGATHYVTVSPGDDDFETKELAEKYTVLIRNERYAIIDISRPRQ